jgi:hypothetical protein
MEFEEFPQTKTKAVNQGNPLGVLIARLDA